MKNLQDIAWNHFQETGHNSIPYYQCKFKVDYEKARKIYIGVIVRDKQRMFTERCCGMDQC